MLETFVGVTAAAKATGLSASTISRYLRRYPELNRGAGKRPRVSVAELNAHRARFVNAARSNSHAGGLMDDPPAAAAENEPGERRSPDRPTYAAAKTLREAAQAQTAQLDLAERLGQLLARADVEAALTEAGATLQQKQQQRRRALAEILAAAGGDVRAIAAALEDDDRALLNATADVLEEQLTAGVPAAA